MHPMAMGTRCSTPILARTHAWRRRLAGLALAATLLTACLGSDSSADGPGVEAEPATTEQGTTVDDDAESSDARNGRLFRAESPRAIPFATAVLGLAIGLGLGLVIGAAGRRRRDARRGPPAAPDAAEESVAGSDGSGRVAHPRGGGPTPDDAATPRRDTPLPGQPHDGAILAAVHAAIDAHDLADHANDENQIVSVRRILEHLDVHPYDPVGAPFDHATQQALEARSSSDPTRDMTVAATIRLGWRHTDGRVVRPAEVEVWRHQPTNVR